MSLEVFWFLVVGFLLTMYAVLDGFDLGVGVIHLWAKGDRERRLFLNAIGPVWDGNEVWLVTFGGALFGAFPRAFATAFSAFYTPFMLLLMALIFRGVALEFRSKSESKKWRAYWDAAFSAGSTSMAFLFGVTVGNTMVGLPIDANGYYRGDLANTLSIFPLLVGVLSVSLFALHGCLYLYLKTEGDLQERLRRLAYKLFGFYAICFLIVTIYAFQNVPFAVDNFYDDHHLDWVALGANALLLASIPIVLKGKSAYRAFLASSLHIASLTLLFASSLYPHLLHSSFDPTWHLSIYNAASSEATLVNMRRIAVLGAPLALFYTFIVYWIFRGKVQLDEHSY